MIGRRNGPRPFDLARFLREEEEGERPLEFLLLFAFSVLPLAFALFYLIPMIRSYVNLELVVLHSTFF